MIDAAHAVTALEAAASEAGLDRAMLAGFWDWLTEVKYAHNGGELTHDNVNQILPRISQHVGEYQETRDKDLEERLRELGDGR